MILRQFGIYLLVGVLTAIVDIGTMQLLLVAGLGYSLAVSAGFGVGLLFNYVTHQRITFKAVHSATAVWRFVVLVLLNYGITLGCVEAAVHMLDSVMAGKLLSLPVVALNGFVLGRHWVFAPRE